MCSIVFILSMAPFGIDLVNTDSNLRTLSYLTSSVDEQAELVRNRFIYTSFPMAGCIDIILLPESITHK